KVSGTREGITGIQLDLKARGLSMKQIEEIFEQAKEGRIDLITQMEKTIPAPRDEISDFAPGMETLKIDPDKIGKLIGPGGKMIRGLQDKHGVQIDVEEDGTVFISAVDGTSLKAALAEVEALCESIKVGAIYEGKVVSVKDFGAFVELAPGTDGMCHISELDNGYVEKVSNVVKIGDSIRVKVINVDDQGRIKLSRKALMQDEAADKGGDDKSESEDAEATASAE
ncbi:MAG: S1 RNA-binding domain-containing protein, partial [Phycisphaerales bacterium JB061]